MLIVLQGIPGSGKSTLAKELAVKHDAVIYSTDDFFVDENGKYVFDGSKLPLFHKMNQDRTFLALKEGKNVVVDNTNINNWQSKKYVEDALKLGHDIQFVRATGNFKNIHGVPDQKVEQMRKSMEDLTVEGCLNAKAPWEK